jgi:hypothetical protein
MREQIESLGMQVDGAHESMEMTLTEFMENVAGKLEAMDKRSPSFTRKSIASST